MVIGKALPSRSFPEGVNISPSPSFLPLCLFFSNSIFSPKHHYPPRTGKECCKAFGRNKTCTRGQKCEVILPTVIPENLPLRINSTFCVLSVIHLYISLFTALVGLSRPTAAFLRCRCLLMTFNDDLLWLIKPASVTGSINFNYSVVRS